LISRNLRKRIQEKTFGRIKYSDDFISEEYINFLTKELSNKGIAVNDILRNLFGENTNSAVIITHDVEEKEGFDFIPELIAMDRKYGFTASYNIVPYKYKIDNGIINLINQSGCEIGIHGYNHDGKLYFSEKIFNSRAPLINKAVRKYGASGFRSPMVHRNIEWLQKLDIEYDASCFDYDPFQPFPGGVGSIWPFIAGKFVEMPYTLPQDHTMFYVLKVRDISIWKNKIDWIVRNNGMILLLTHPDYLQNKNNFKLYEELLEYLNSLNNTLRCLPREMSRYWNNVMNKNDTAHIKK
jgi:peptidoglycan/xylan/chitin deacetylase (PgdA/CDA1 family)